MNRQTAVALIAHLLNKGADAMSCGRTDIALDSQRTILQIDPRNTAALANMGHIYRLLQQDADAEHYYRAVLQYDAGDWEALHTLAHLRQNAGDTGEAETLLRRALRHPKADRAAILKNLGFVLLDEARWDDSVQCYRAALRLTPGDMASEYALSFALLGAGHFEEGWQLHEARIAPPPPTVALPWQLHAPFDAPQWRGETLHGKAVAVYCEGGWGDVFQFIRYVPLVAATGARVLLTLPRVMQRILSGLDGVAQLRCSEDTEPLPVFDYQCSLLSLPHALDTAGTIPPPVALRADPAAWTDFLSGLPGLKVGLCWAGSNGYPADNRRSMQLSDLAPLLSVTGCGFVSLQLGPAAEQMQALPPGVLHDVSRRLLDWQDTGDLIMGLDLIVSVDTAITHLAATLGKPVWMLDRAGHCWRWLHGRNDSPWYSSLKIYRQVVAGDWTKPIAAVLADLTKMAHTVTDARAFRSGSLPRS